MRASLSVTGGDEISEQTSVKYQSLSRRVCSIRSAFTVLWLAHQRTRMIMIWCSVMSAPNGSTVFVMGSVLSTSTVVTASTPTTWWQFWVCMNVQKHIVNKYLLWYSYMYHNLSYRVVACQRGRRRCIVKVTAVQLLYPHKGVSDAITDFLWVFIAATLL